MSVHESILLEKSGLTEAGVPLHSTSIARAEVLQADSHSSPPTFERTNLLKDLWTETKKKPHAFAEGRKNKKKKTKEKILKKHKFGYFLGLFFLK